MLAVDRVVDPRIEGVSEKSPVLDPIILQAENKRLQEQLHLYEDPKESVGEMNLNINNSDMKEEFALEQDAEDGSS